MEKPKVYYIPGPADMKAAVDRLLDIISSEIADERVGFKIHFGERNNTTHLRPDWLRGIPQYFKHASFVECNVLYRGSRTRKADHVGVAKEHGFGFLPIDILDGEMGEAEEEVEVSLKNTRKARLGKGITGYEHLVALTHFKGHMATGFGGCLKNIGMGLGSRAGKMDMHAIMNPVVKKDKCVECGTCVADCPVDAITLNPKAEIDADKCIGCVHCVAVCPNAAIDIPWSNSLASREILMEKIAEYAAAASKGRDWWFVNFLTDITYDCDCMGYSQKPFMKDVGVLLCKDPIAADAASLKLVSDAYGGDPFFEKFNVDGSHILRYGQEIGLGTTDFELVRLE